MGPTHPKTNMIYKIRSSISLCFFLLLTGQNIECSTTKKPNLIIMMMDDAGYTDIGLYGSDIKTPHIDKLIKEGINFTSCHAMAPNCSPSRAALLTGRFPTRSGIYSYIPKNHVMHLKKSELTLATWLKKHGYATFHAGKWHLGALDPKRNQCNPSDHGFDYWLATENNTNHLNPKSYFRNGVKTGSIKGYSCELMVKEAQDWLDKKWNPEQPFFVNIWFNEPHTPLSITKEFIEDYRSFGKKNAPYMATVANVDKAIGQMMNFLEKKGLRENTMILVTSDNGPLKEISHKGLRGKKSYVYEGGTRVFGSLSWTNSIDPGLSSKTPVGLHDIFPTFCDAAEIPLPSEHPLDGVSLMPLINGKKIQREKDLFWFFYRTSPSAAVIRNRYKIVGYTNDTRKKTHSLTKKDMPYIKNSKLIRFEMYDLENDIGEKNDISKQKPEKFHKLRQVLIRLHAEVVKEGVNWDIPISKVKKKKS